jgi:hypothetical protein
MRNYNEDLKEVRNQIKSLQTKIDSGGLSTAAERAAREMIEILTRSENEIKFKTEKANIIAFHLPLLYVHSTAIN